MAFTTISIIFQTLTRARMTWVGWMLYSTRRTDRDHVLVGKEDGVVGTANLLEMVPGDLEGQISGRLFSNSIIAFFSTTLALHFNAETSFDNFEGLCSLSQDVHNYQFAKSHDNPHEKGKLETTWPIWNTTHFDHCIPVLGTPKACPALDKDRNDQGTTAILLPAGFLVSGKFRGRKMLDFLS